MYDYRKSAGRIGELLNYKQRQYGSRSLVQVEGIMHVLYPDGIPSEAFADALLLVRIADKLCRITSPTRDAQDGESPFDDIAGYALLGQKLWYEKRGKPADVAGAGGGGGTEYDGDQASGAVGQNPVLQVPGPHNPPYLKYVAPESAT